MLLKQDGCKIRARAMNTDVKYAKECIAYWFLFTFTEIDLHEQYDL